MLLMAGFTIAYEYQRCMCNLDSSLWSLIAIIILLIGIFGVILISEDNPIHYIFAAAVFFAMLAFMTGHTYYVSSVTNGHLILYYAQLLFMTITVIGLFQGTSIFIAEALFILNFAVFYVYLHFHTIAPVFVPAPAADSSSASSPSSPINH